jgi:hypothetical protein
VDTSQDAVGVGSEREGSYRTSDDVLVTEHFSGLVGHGVFVFGFRAGGGSG